jgi:hypothetical protein
MAYQVVWGKCNVFVGQEGERKQLVRGQFIPVDLDPTQVSNLVTCGAVRFIDVSLAPELAEDVPEGPFPSVRDIVTEPIPQARDKGSMLQMGTGGVRGGILAAEPSPLVVVPGLDTATPEATPAVQAPPPEPEQPVASPTEEAPADSVEEPPAPEVPEKPSQSDLKGDWVAYAVAQGTPEDEASAMSKADLVAKFS